jgi:nucleotide-binding universal stress UspA family protein
MHRVLVAHDGSEHAEQAVGLVAHLPWPPHSVIRLMTVIPSTREMRRAWRPLALERFDELEAQVMRQTEAFLVPARDRVTSQGLDCETHVAKGRPPQAIANEARRFRASLLVVGSRGLGSIEGTLLGSVSAELVDLAPCPVLVARRQSLQRVVFATDGSPDADQAERFLATLPIAHQVPVSVASVAEIVDPWVIGLWAGTNLPAADAHGIYQIAQEQSRGASAESAERLRAAGIEARPATAVGNAAAEILTVAESLGADLIVLGTRGRTGLRRLVLGSVARRVLQQATASVLIVRQGLAHPG